MRFKEYIAQKSPQFYENKALLAELNFKISKISISCNDVVEEMLDRYILEEFGAKGVRPSIYDDKYDVHERLYAIKEVPFLLYKEGKKYYCRPLSKLPSTMSNDEIKNIVNKFCEAFI